MDFTTTLYNVLIMFFYMIPAFMLVKFKIASSSHAQTLSAILLYICNPAMMIHCFQITEYSNKNLAKIGEYFLTTLILMGLLILILYFALKAKYEDSKYRILTIASSLGNVGFFGQPLVKALYPDDNIVACYSSVYTMAMCVLAVTLGVFALTNDKKYISIKSAILNPMFLGVVAGVIIYVSKWHFPTVLGNAVEILSKMTTPVCMHILGMRLASVSLIELIRRPFVYVTCLFKLIVFPLFAYLLVRFIPFFDDVFKGTILVLSGAPSAAVILSLAELYQCEQELTSNVVLLSTILCVVTLPVISLLKGV